MIIVRQSTARTVTVGPVLDADGVAVTGGVVGDFKISKNGGAPAALNGSATATHRHTGFYSLALTASDLDTVGQAEVVIDDTTNSMGMKELSVIEEAVYDALFAASAIGYVANAPVSVAQWAGTNVATPTVAGVPKVDLTHVAGATTNVAALATNVDAILTDTSTTLDDLIDTEIATLITEVGKIPKSDGTSSWNATALAAIQSEANDALVAYDPPTKAELDSAVSPLATAANLSTVAGYLDTEIAAILADTNELQTDWVNGGRLDLILDARASQTSVDDLPTNAELATALASADDATLAAIAGLNDLSAADVNAEVDTALADIHLDHLLAVTYDPASKPGASDALLNELVESDAGVTRYTANALEQGPGGGSAPTASEIADAVWDEDLTGHTTTDSAGEILGNVATGTPPTAAAIADAVWDEAQADHVTAGSFGIVASEIADVLVDTSTTLQGELDGIQADTEDIQSRLPAALVSGRMDASVGAAAANTLTASALAADAVTEIQSGLATASALSTVAGYLDTEIAAILADTNELQTDWVNGGRLDLILDARASQTSVDDVPTNAELATALGTADDAVLAQVALVKAKTDLIPTDPADQSAVEAAITAATSPLATAAAVADLPTNAELATALAAADDAVLAAIAALNDLSAAQVNAEVVDALATDVIADSIPADGSRPTIAQALYILTQFMTERAVSGTTMTVKKPDGSTTLLTLTLNDGTSPTSITRAS